MQHIKKGIALLCLTIALCFSGTSFAQSNNTSGIEGQARGIFAQCLSDYQGTQWEVFTVASPVVCVTAPCLVDYEVTVGVCPKCLPNQICSRRPCIALGTVSFKDGQVVSIIDNCP